MEGNDRYANILLSESRIFADYADCAGFKRGSFVVVQLIAFLFRVSDYYG